VKFLGLAAKKRSPVAPDVPNAAEIGLPDLTASAWFAIVAPPGTPEAIVQKINKDTAALLKLDDVRTRFLEQGRSRRASRRKPPPPSSRKKKRAGAP
jgi:tripartite-type tricarboxylate transporter receptor subunit TctC